MAGSATEALLGLGPSERAALVYLRGTVSGEPALCSGVLVAADWMLTARHCTQVVSDLGHEIGNEEQSLGGAVERREHPTLDLMLLRVSRMAEGVQPLPWAALDDTLLDTALVELAGFGEDRSGEWGRLRFVVAEVMQRDATRLRAAGVGASGACDGDSGGPLLQRLPSGALGVAGVLAGGSQSCAGTDTYTRLVAADDWLREHVGAPAEVGGCGTLSDEGRCFGSRAVHCARGRVAASDCAAPRVCGWSELEQGYRCVDPERDSCTGVSELGDCVGDAALHCERGAVVMQRCESCAARCERAPATGRVGCTP